MKFHFSCICQKTCTKKNTFHQDECIFLLVGSKYPILYMYIVRFLEMKVHSYARSMNLNRKCVWGAGAGSLEGVCRIIKF